MHWLPFVACLATACVVLSLERRHSASTQRTRRNRLGKRRKAAEFTEYAGVVPYVELLALSKFVRSVHKRRGWDTGSFHFTAAWSKLAALAQTANGGAWRHDFAGEDITNHKLGGLALMLDQVFFGSSLHLQFSRGKHGPMHYQVVEQCPYGDSWIAYFDDQNVVFFNRSRWHQVVSKHRPVNCEGVVCSSRLELLMHTLAHELVHAIVYNLFPEIDQASQAYLADDRHGPIFHLLNKKLFGHTSTSYEYIHQQASSFR